jgi:hypothetical protein
MSKAAEKQLIIYSPRIKSRVVQFPKPRRVLDFLVVFFCLSIAAGSIWLFYQSLTQTLASSEEPVGFVVERYNSVQRRMGDRVLWDRLYDESLLYPGDIIRVADFSSAILHFGGNQIELEDNTLIRVTMTDGIAQIELSTGTLNLASSEESENINLVIGSKTIEAGQGTVLSASASVEGMSLRVSEGTAVVSEEGLRREAAAGSLIAEDAQGTEQFIPSVVVLRPRSNTRLLKSTSEPEDVLFAWNGINIDSSENLLLEITNDRNFNRITTSIDAYNTAEISLNEGLWHWRLVYRDEVMHTSRFTITEAAAPSLILPQAGTVITYPDNLPPVRFQWTETPEASHYLLEISQTPDFMNPHTRSETWGTSIAITNLAQGSWYWRVRPVFTSGFEGSGGISPIAGFRLEQEIPGVTPTPFEDIFFTEPEPEPEPPPPPPPLAPPVNLQPANNFRLGPAEIRASSSIDFSWAAVNEANAYILTIYHQTAAGRRQVVSTNPLARNGWSLYDFSVLDIGTFIWQVEAVNRDSAGLIERRGIIAESSFIIDIPVPQVRLQSEGRMYGIQ